MEEVVMKRIYVVLKYPRHTEIYRIIFSFKLDHEINENVTLSPEFTGTYCEIEGNDDLQTMKNLVFFHLSCHA